MKSMNRFLAILLSVLMIMSSMPVFASAASVSDFSDFPTGSWSEKAMTSAVNNHLLVGKGDGTIAPGSYITRAEAMAVINRAFGAEVKADISAYTDVDSSAWYYGEVAKAVNMRTIMGVSATEINPTGYITRESMLSVLARALVLDDADSSVLNTFVDGSKVSSWAKGSVAAMAVRGYVNGNEKKELNPQSYITREEFAQVMDNIFKVYIPDNTTLTGVTYGTTIIRAKDVTLNDTIIQGDLVVGDGVGKGNLNLNNVTVTGRILFRGGEGNVKLINTSVGEKVVINDVNGVVNFLNYRAEEPFKNIQENTEAKFLNMYVNTGGSGSSSPKRETYKIREYLQNLDGTYPSKASYSDEKKADYAQRIVYEARPITGYTLDTTHPDAVLEGSNRGELVIRAYYKRNVYKVEFNGYEIELPYGQNINVNDVLVEKLEEAIKNNLADGYYTEFKDGKGNIITIDGTTVGLEDIKIEAIKTPIEYNINYDLNGGKLEGTYPKNFNVESAVTLPTPVKEGYEFIGWTDETGTSVTAIPAGTKGDKSFTANWKAKEYTITYVTGANATMDGVAGVKISYTVEDEDYTLPAPVVTNGEYIFLGWYDNASFTGAVVTVVKNGSVGNKTFYANIKERTHEKYTITFDGVDYTVEEGKEISEAVDANGNKLGDAMDTVTYPKGYEADDFRKIDDETVVITKDTIAFENMEIVAAKKAIVYTIVYVLNYGSLDGSQKTTYTVEDADYTLPVPSRTNHIFKGWFENEDFSGEKVTVLDTADAENKTYYANWLYDAPGAKRYTITFNGKEYKVTENNNIYSNDSLKTAMEEAQNKPGYTVKFNTKEDGTGTDVTGTYVPTSNMTIYVVETLNTYTITYNLGGIGALPADAKQTYTIKELPYTLPVLADTADYTFEGWLDANGNAVTKIAAGTTGNLTFTASWKSSAVLTPSVLSFASTVSGNTVTVKVMLDAIPYDIEEIAAMTLRYAFDNTKLEYAGTASDFGTTSASAGYISWFADADYITADKLAANGGELFTITFIKKAGAYGDTAISYTSTEIVASEPVGEPAISTKYTTKDGTINLGDAPSTVSKLYFDASVNGNTVKVKVMLDAIPYDIEEIAAMTLRYAFDNSKLEYVGTASDFGTTSASAGYISWFTDADYITADKLAANGGELFEITFTKKAGAYGDTAISYTSTEIVASEPVGEPAISTKYTTENKTINLGVAPSTKAKLYFDASVNGNAVTVKVMLDAIPYDIEEIAAMTIRYAFDNTKLEYAGTTSDFGTTSASAGYISWFTDADYITADKLAANGGELFTITFTKKAGAYGDAAISYTSTEIVASEPIGEPAISTMYTTEGETITLEREEYTITFNGVEYTVWENDFLYSNAELKTAMENAQNKPGCTVVFNTKADGTGTPVTGAYIPTTDMTIYAVETPISYSITYDLGGIGALPADAKKTYTVYELPYVLPQLTHSANYTFEGWKDANGNVVTKIAAGTTGDLTFTAIWEEIPEGSYTITYNLGGIGTLPADAWTSYKTSELPYTLPVLADTEDYTFEGWKDANGNVVTAIVAGTEGNLTFTAEWKLKVVQTPSVLSFASTVSGNTVTVKVMLDAIPYDIEEIAAMTLRYAFDNSKLEYVGTTSDFGTTSASAGYISWFADADYITADKLAANGGELFEITFTKKAGAYGDTTISYTSTEIVASEPVGEPAISTKYTTLGEVIHLGSAPQVKANLYFDASVNGNAVTVKVMLDAIPYDIEEIAAMTLRYAFDNSKLEYVGTTSDFGTTSASAGYISWFTDADYITADKLAANGGELFTITFNRKAGAYGNTDISYTYTEIVASEPVGAPVISTKYTTSGEVIDLGTAPLTEANLYFDASVNGNTVKVKVMLDAIPYDIEEIAAMTLRYAFDNTKLEYVGTASDFGTTSASAGYISWFTDADYITADKLAAKVGELFEITFTKKAGAYGDTEISYTSTEIVASEPVGEPVISTKYTTENKTINLGVAPSTPSKLYFDASVNGNTVTVKVMLDAIPYDIEEIAAMTLRYIFDDTKLEYAGTNSDFGTTSASAGYISWFTDADYITADKLAAKVGELFTITFNKKAGAYGDTSIYYTSTEIVASEPIGEPVISTKYTTESETITLERTEYVITFNGVEYPVFENTTLYSNANLKTALEDAQNKTGYTVVFNTKADGTGTPVTGAYIPTTDMTIYAVETPISYAIAYDLGGIGVLPADAKLTYTLEELPYNLPVLAHTADYTFEGWKDANGNVVSEIAAGTTGDLTFTAIWEAIPEGSYTITYNLGGIGALPADAWTTYKTSQLPYTLPVLADTEDYTFEGWKDANGNTVTAIAAGTAGNLTFTAIWELIPETVYTITYNLGGIGTLPADAWTEYKTSQLPYTLPVLADTEDYTFEGWKDANGNVVTAIAAGTTGNLAFTAVWKEIPETVYTITYNLGGIGELPADAWVEYKTSQLPYVLPQLAHTENFTFEGWKDANGNVVTAIAAGTTGNLTFTAIWEAIPEGAYTITYNLGGIGALPAGTWTTYKTSQLPYTLPVLANAGEYIFEGWKDANGNVVTEIAAGTTGNLTFTAIWETLSTLSFDASVNGDTITVKVMLDAIPYDIEEIAAMTLRYAFDNTKFDYVDTASDFGTTSASAGYISWFTDADYITADKLAANGGVLFTITFTKKAGAYGDTAISFTSTEIVASEPITNPAVTTKYTTESKVITLERTAYNIVFNGTEYPVFENEALYSNANLKTAMENAQNKTGYTVVFNTKADGTGTPVTGAYVPADDMTIYAVETPISYAIAYDLGGIGALPTDAKLTYTIEEIPYTLPVLEDTANFSFEGWKDANGNVVTEIAAGTTGDLTFTAIWEAIPEAVYTITYNLGGIGTLPADAWTTYKTSQLPYTLPVLADTADYTFEGWKDANGNEVTEIAAGTTGSLTFTAIWEAIPETVYTITYNLGGIGTLPADAWTEYKASQLPYALPVLAHTADYTFEGWKDANGNVVSEIAAGTTGDLTFTAIWEAIPEGSYTITYDLGGIGTLPADAWTTYKTSQLPYTLPVLADTEDYTFEGWKDANGNVVTAIAAGTAGNLTFTAIWELIPETVYTITYNLGGIGVLPADAWVEYKTSQLPYVLPQLAHTENFTFEGWKDANGNVVTAIAAGTTGDLTFTAIWEAIPEGAYTITYNLGGIGALPADAWTTYKTSQLPYTLPVLANAGEYIFEGWKDANGNVVSEIAAGTTGNLTFTAIWETLSTLSFDASVSGSTVTVKVMLDAIPYDIEEIAAMTIRYAFDNTKLEYTGTTSDFGTVSASAGYISWFTDADYITADKLAANGGELFTITFAKKAGAYGDTAISYTSTEIVASEPIINPAITTKYTTEGDTFYLEEDVYTISYVLSGIGELPVGVWTTYKTSELPYTLPVLADTEEYTFEGWKDANGNVVTTIAAGTAGNLIFTAIWKEIIVIEDEYAITYNLGGIGELPADAWTTYKTSQLPYVLPQLAHTENFTFEGWKDANGNVVTEIAAGTTGDLTFTAIWEAIPEGSYTITYNLGGIGTLPADAWTTYKTSQLPYTLPVLADTEDYTFEGWKDANGNVVTAIAAGTTGDLAFTAIWEAIPEAVYTITYNLGGIGTLPADAWTEYKTSELPYTLPVLADTADYTFEGWKNSNGNDVTEIATGTTGNLTFTAVWKEIPETVYTITYNLGGIGELPADAWVEYKTSQLPYVLPQLAHTANFTFEGWKDANGNVVTAIAAGTTGDLTFTAIWEAIPEGAYTITYNLGGIGALPADAWTTYKTSQLPYTLPVLANAGEYIFEGWKDANGNVVTAIAAGTTGNLTFTAIWEKLSTLSFDASVSGSTITVKVTLDEIPYDIEEIAALTLRYSYDKTKLEYTGTTSDFGTVSASAGYISWFTDADYITADKLAANGGALFTITFNKKAGVSGTTEIAYTSTEIVASEPIANPVITTKYTTGSEEIYLEEDVYTISYVLGGIGALPADAWVEYKTSDLPYILPVLADTEEYTFEGWKDANGNVATVISAGTVGNLIFTAIWKEIIVIEDEYAITYNLGGIGTLPADAWTEYKTSQLPYTLPVLADTEDYTFEGWKDANGNVVTAIAAGTTGNLAFTAVWKEIPEAVYTITYNLGGIGTLPADAWTEYKTSQLPYTLPVLADTADYTFEGWKNSNGNDVTEIATGTTGNLTFTAVWKEIPEAVYTITYNLGGIGELPVDAWVEYKTSQLPYVLPQIAHTENFTFEGWKDANGNVVTAIAEGTTGDLTFTAIWEAIPEGAYTITYNLGGIGALPADAWTTYKTSQLPYTLPVLANAGEYIFEGWKDANGNVVTAISAGTTGNLTFTAIWEKLSTLSFDASVSGSTVTVKVMLDEIPYDIEEIAALTLRYSYDKTKLEYTGTTSNVGSASTSAGYISWYTEADYITADKLAANGGALFTITFNKKAGVSGTTEIAYTSTEIVASEPITNPVITTKYTTGSEEIYLEEDVYTISYVLGGIGVLPADAWVEYKTSDLPYILPVLADTEEYTFEGWKDANGNVATVISAGTTGNLTYTAIWQEIIVIEEEYDISYDLGGIGTLPADAWTTYKTSQLPYVLPQLAHTENFTFEGWKDANGNVVTEIAEGTTGDLVFTAIWEAIPEGSYTITYDLGGIGTLPADAWTTYKTSQLPYTLPVLADTEDYTFEGWKDANGNTVTAIAAGTAGNLTFTAIWEAIPEAVYTITYNLGGIGELPADAWTEYKTSQLPYTLPVLADTEDYTFEGWQDANGNTVTAIAAGTAGNLTFTAIWEEIPEAVYTITYNLGGIGALPADAWTTYKTSQLPYTLPVLADTEDYTFEGWKDANGNTVTAIAAGTTGNLTFTAIWEAIPEAVYTITYNLGGIGALPADAWTEYKASQLPYTLPVLADTEEYTFEGWKDANGNVVTAIATGTTGSLTFTAIWEEIIVIEEEYDISYDLGGIGTLPADAWTTYKTSELPYTLPVLADTSNFTFEGWKDANGNVVTEIAEGTTGDLTFTTIWEAIPEAVYTITYNLGGIGELPADAWTTYKASELPYTLPVLADTSNFTFEGWKDANGNVVTEIAEGTTGDLTFTAIWEAIPEAVYTITYNLGGIGTLPADAWTTYKASELPYTLPVLAHTADYTFEGWQDANGNVVTEIAEGTTGNLTFTAIWEAIPEAVYTITYNLGGIGTLPADAWTEYKTSELPYTLPVLADTEDYTFEGWKNSNGNDVTEIAAGTTGNLTFTAVWKAIPEAVYTITYNLGGIGELPADAWVEYKTSQLPYVLPQLAHTANFTFEGWEDADGNIVTTIAAGTTGNLTFTAIWEAIPEGSYTITYDLGGIGTLPAGVWTTYKTSQLPYTLPILANAGEYIFEGWKDANGNVVTEIVAGTTGNLTFAAIWEKLSTLSFDASVNGNEVTVKVVLDAIPYDIEEIAAMTLRYAFDNTKLEYVGTTSNVGSASTSSGFISWYTLSDYITEDILAENGGELFTITFNKKAGVSGTTEIAYTSAEIVASEPITNPAISTKYTTGSEEIYLEADVYTISYVLGGIGELTTDAKQTYTAYELPYILPVLADTEEYTFEGWKDANGNVATVISAGTTGDLTFTAIWQEIIVIEEEYAISYDLGGIGELPADAWTTYKASELPYTLPVLADTSNFTFEGWQDANGNVVTEIAEGTTGDLTFTAIWELIPEAVYTITYNLGGIGTLPADAWTTYKTSQLPYTLPVLADTEDYTFEGWQDANGNVVTEIATGTTGSLTFTAIWEEIPEDVYTITYNLDGIGTLPADAWTTYKTSQLPYTLPVLADTEDYTFEGWQDANGNVVTEIAAGTAGNLTFTAIWEEIPEDVYTITYNLGGIGTLPADAWTTYKASELPYTLPVLAHTEDYTFEGWQDANGNVVTEIAAGTTGDLTFTAIWEEIPEDAYTITYVTNGGTLDGTQKTTYTASELPYTLPTPQKDGVPFVGWFETDDFSDEAVTEIAAGTTGDKTYYAKWQTYTVKFYAGTVRRPNFVDEITVESGAYLTTSEIEELEVFGDQPFKPENYTLVDGYTDADGVVHKVSPELWYEQDGEWVKYVPETVPVLSDMTVCLLTRYVEISYTTDLKIKGVDMEEIGEISVSAAYDSETDLGKTVLDLLSNAGERMRRVLGLIEDQGYDLYQMGIDKAASTGLMDSDGNIIKPNVAIPLHKFITEERIMNEINKYINENINNEEFIADLLKNDAVVDMIIGDEELKHSAMGDPEIREIFITDDFIKEMIRLHPEFVDIIIDHDEFVELIIDNDATFNYVLEDETMVAKILDNSSFKNKIIEKGTNYIIDNYFGTGGDAEVKDYITKQLKTNSVKSQLKSIIHNDAAVKQSLKETLITDEDAKAILKDKIKGMLDDPETEADIRGEVRSYLLSNSLVLRADIKDYISENSAALRADIKAYIGNNSEALRADIKAYIGNNSAELRDDIKSYIGNNSAALRGDIKAYIGNNSAALRGDIKSYIGSNSAALRGDIKSYIKAQKNTIKTDVISYIETNASDFKAENKRAEILNKTANPEIWNSFEAEFNTLQTRYPVLTVYAFDQFVADFISGALATDHPAEYADVVISYNKAIDDNLSTYVNSNYDDLFDDYFDDYYTGLSDAKYQELFDDNFSGYYDGLSDAKYQELFNDNFSGYYDGLSDVKYQELFNDNFSGYYDGLSDAKYQELFNDNFSGYYDGLSDAKYQELFNDNFSGYYDGLSDAKYQELFDDNFSGYYDGLSNAEYQELFNDNFTGYFDGLTSAEFKDLFNSKFEDFFTKQYNTLFDEYFDDYFDTMFDSLYDANVEKWAKMAYDEPTTKATVTDTIEDVISDLIADYVAGNADQELKDFINKIVEDFDVKGYVRDNYSTDPDLKATIDTLVKDNAKDIIDDYANNRASAEIVTLIDDNMHKYIEEIVDDYVSYELDDELMTFIDEEINIYMMDYINKYITGEDRELLSKLVPTYAQDAVEAIKKTDAFKNTISDFVSGNGVRVNEGNIMFIEILDELMHTYNYDKLAGDFLPAKAKQIIDLVGHDTVAGIVNDYFAAFCAEMDEAVENLNADLDAGIEGTEYKFSTSPAVRINVMKIIDNYYTKLTGKLRDKINSLSKIPVSSNPYAQRIVDLDYLGLFLDRTEETEYKSGYKLKDDVMEYYTNWLNVMILMHDAVTFYGERSEYTLEDRLDAASLLVGTYANKANDVIMNFIENGELPKGYSLEDILNINGTIENLYNKFADKIEKGEDLYAEYLDKDYTEIVDFANMSIYSGGDSYKIYQIILENGADAFDFDDAVTAIFDSPNYRGISKLENAMAKVESKIKGYSYTPEKDVNVYYKDAYKGTFENKEIKGFETGTHTVSLNRHLSYYIAE